MTRPPDIDPPPLKRSRPKTANIPSAVVAIQLLALSACLFGLAEEEPLLTGIFGGVLIGSAGTAILFLERMIPNPSSHS